MKWSSGVDFIGKPAEVIQQATQDDLNFILNQVNNQVYEFTAKTPESPNELATGWKYGPYLITNAHAAIALLSMKDLIPTAKGKYIAQPLKSNDRHELILRIISRQNDLSALLFDKEFPGELTLRDTSPKVGEGCFIVGRSIGTNKKGIMAGKVKRIGNARFYYDIETKPGSSGSPILDINGEVIGVHQGITPESGSYHGWAIGITNDKLRPIVNKDVEVITQESGFQLPENIEYYALGGAGIVLLSQLAK